MRKLSLLTILLLAPAWVLAQSNTRPIDNSQYPSGTAQQPAQQPDTSKTGTKTADAAHTIEGCLSGAANTFTLTDASGVTYELLDDTSQLAENVGHQVRLWGSAGSTGGGARTSASGPQRIFGVKKVESLSSTCANK